MYFLHHVIWSVINTVVWVERADFSSIDIIIFTLNFVVSVRRSFLFLLELRIGCVILLCHSLGPPYNYFECVSLTHIPCFDQVGCCLRQPKKSKLSVTHIQTKNKLEAFIFNFLSWDLDAVKILRCYDIVWQMKQVLVFITEQVNVYLKRL